MKNLLALSTLTMAFLISATTASAAVLVPQGEPFEQGIYQEDAAEPYAWNSSQNSTIDSTNTNKIHWHYDLQYDVPGDYGMKTFHGTPAIDKEGIVYMNSMDGYTRAFNEDGSIKWTSDNFGGTNNSNSIVIGKDGTLYNPSRELYAINPEDGTTKWMAKTDETSRINNLVIDKDGLIYALNNYSSNRRLYAFNPDGTVHHKGSVNLSTYGEQVLNKPMLLGKNGLIYLQTSNSSYRYLLAINKQGEMVWNIKLGYDSSGFTLDKDGSIIYTGGWAGNKQEIYRINGDTGEIIVKKTLLDKSNAPISVPTVDYSNGDIYLGMDLSTYKVDKDFNVIWNKKYGTTSGISLDKSRNILFTSAQGVFKLNKDGEEIWKLPAADISISGAIIPIDFAPALDKNGRVYTAYNSSRSDGSRYDLISIGDPVMQWDDTCVNYEAMNKKMEDGTMTATEQKQEIDHLESQLTKLKGYTPSN